MSGLTQMQCSVELPYITHVVRVSFSPVPNEDGRAVVVVLRPIAEAGFSQLLDIMKRGYGQQLKLLDLRLSWPQSSSGPGRFLPKHCDDRKSPKRKTLAPKEKDVVHLGQEPSLATSSSCSWH